LLIESKLGSEKQEGALQLAGLFRFWGLLTASRVARNASLDEE